MNGTLKNLYEDKNISLEQGEKNYFEQACKPRKRDYEIPIIECRLPEEQAKIVEDVSRKMTDAIIKQLEKEK